MPGKKKCGKKFKNDQKCYGCQIPVPRHTLENGKCSKCVGHPKGQRKVRRAAGRARYHADVNSESEDEE